VSCFGATDPSIALQLWTLTRNAPTKVQLTLPGSGDQELCLDFGSNPANGGEVKVWECLDVPQQMFWYTSDNRLSLYNAGKSFRLSYAATACSYRKQGSALTS
jgi:hypothetical protein